MSINERAPKRASEIDLHPSLGTMHMPKRAQAGIVDPRCAEGHAHSRMQTRQESHMRLELHTPMAAWPCHMCLDRVHPGAREPGENAHGIAHQGARGRPREHMQVWTPQGYIAPKAAHALERACPIVQSSVCACATSACLVHSEASHFM